MERRKFSTYTMVEKLHELRGEANITILRTPEPADAQIKGMVWDESFIICSCFHTAASVTELQSCSTYVTLIQSSKLISLLISKFKNAIRSNDTTLLPTATAMLEKIQQYSHIVCSPLAHLSKVVDPRYWTDFRREADVFRLYVELPRPSKDQGWLSHDLEWNRVGDLSSTGDSERSVYVAGLSILH